jgi:dUTPase
MYFYNIIIKMTVLKFKLLDPKAIMPTYAHADDAGFGIYSIEEKTLIPIEIVEDLSDSSRGEGGFGSTGRK